MARAASRESLLELLAPVVTDAGCDLEDVVVTPAGRRRLVRVVVDRDEGLPLDVVADVSTAVSAALDAADALGETPYVLEVTSPGVSRPLTEPRHWRRAAGRLVEVPLVEGGAPLLGRVVSADEEAVVLSVGGDGAGDERRLAYAELGPGRVQVEFSRKGEDAELQEIEGADDEDADEADDVDNPDDTDDADDTDDPDDTDDTDKTDEEA
ncbi:ribosome maturation factor RimP [Motilibacter deserti]|uniref:Ribosome maturation factor RimP n=1 Tax=Motilibacter deserti TaxID=2714956 RepID=A0ABX0GRS5_9ACTN|nr:ribosome maturation factor RimP [Motilibacter deserti]NHC13573.1 ribosome maturation factor RimP [Motilibacter deserti]